MIRTVKRCTSLAATLFIGAILAQGSQAQAPPAGVFSEIQTAVVPRTSPVLEPATVRSRMVRLDTQRINAARRGREILKLNLFDDAEVEVQIRQVRSTRSGYFISGRPRGMDWGEVRLVVSGSVMVGTVISPEGEFTIRSAGSGRHVIRQIDPLQDTFECGADEIPALSPQDLPAVSSIGPAPAGAPSSPAVQAEATPTEDGSEIRILVVYTPALQARQGGVAGMRALVDLMIESANQAYEDSGINPRLVLAHTAMVDYVAKGTNSDLTRLITRDDGYLDEVHTLRNEYAADLVHLLTNVSNGPVGSASRPTFESLSNENRSAFGITANASEHTFTHEVGHNFGLKHDRYVERPSFAIYPYAFGYTNQAAFGSGAPNAARWRTVMTYNNQCAAAGFGCSRLLRFSNPDQSYLGDPMGVAADSTATGPDGPADARLTINTSARWVGSYRSNACTDFTVSPATQLAPRDGGEFNFEVHANPGCLWQASSQEDFISITSDSSSAGRGLVSVSVKANESATDRTGSVVVAGRTVVVRQLSTTDGICGRSPAAMEAIARAAGYSGAAQCSQVTDEDLARIGTLLFGGSGLTSLKSGDFEGLSALTTLSLDTNQLTELPAGLFAGLANLTKLYLGHNDLTEVPAGIFAGLSKLNRLDLASNQLTGLPAGLFAGLANLEILELDFNQLQDLPAGIFGGLTSLEELQLNSNELAELPAGLFAGLANLEKIDLGHNQLQGLPAGIFGDLANLEELNLFFNELTELPTGVFAGLSNLQSLDLGLGRFVTMPADVFSDLSRLEELNFWAGRLTHLSAGAFAGLSNLRKLNLYSNRLTELPAGIFAGLSALEELTLRGNGFTSLPADLFSGLNALKDINLSRNRLESLPEGLFSGLTRLESISLGGNPTDPLPLPLFLQKDGDNGFKAVAPTAAPFALELPVSVGSSGEIQGGAEMVSIPAGASESATLTVTRVADTHGPVEVDFGTLPDLPAKHSGYALSKVGSTPTRLLASSLVTDATLTGVSLSEGKLAPAFSSETAEYTVLVSHAVSSVTVSPAKSNAEATVEFLDAKDQPLADADAGTDGWQANLSVGENTMKLRVTAANRAAEQTYTLVVTRDTAAGVCGRTPEVRAAILKASGIAACTDVTEVHLEAITQLSIVGADSLLLRPGDFGGLTALWDLQLSNNGISILPADLFQGLPALLILQLNDNHLYRLPDGLFSGLSALQSLNLSDNRLTGLSSDIFSGLSALKHLWLNRNQMTVLSADVFSGLSALEWLSLGDNQLVLRPSGMFSDLAGLKQLWLNRNQLRSVPGDLFSGLSNLESLSLSGNRLSSLPAGVFSGLTELKTLRLDLNTVNPLPIPLSLDKVGQDQFKVVAPTGVPFALEVPVRVNSAGAIEGDASTTTIPIGETESPLLRVNQAEGTADAVTVDIGTLPGLPARHRGYIFEKDGALPREILASAAPTRDVALRRLSVSDGTLNPVFDSGVTSFTVRVANAVTSITVRTDTNNAAASLAFQDANGQVLPDSDTATDGHQLNLNTGENTVKVKVTSQDASATRTYTIVVTRNSLPEVTTTSPLSVTENQTAVASLGATDADGDTITWLTNGGADAGLFDITADGVLTFESAPDYEAPGDLDGDNEYVVVVEANDGSDSSYRTLIVSVADLEDESGAPTAGASLSGLALSDGTLSPAFASTTGSYTASVENAVASITVSPVTSSADAMAAFLDGADQTLADADTSAAGFQVDLGVGDNTIKVKVTAGDTTTTQTYTIVVTRESATQESGGVCPRTPEVRDAIVSAVSGVDACEDITDTDLARISSLNLSGEGISSLASGDFDGLTGLGALFLHSNELASLPADVFSGLTALERLNLGGNKLTGLPTGIFSGLAALEELNLYDNSIQSLAAGVFSGLTGLERLNLSSNRMSSLPAGIFSGLTALTDLILSGNTVSPLALSVSLEKVGQSQFKAVAPTGAPFAIELPVSISDAGRIAGGASALTIPIGAVESAVLDVTRVVGTSAAVNVDLGTLPGLPSNHQGYVLSKDAALPLEVLAATDGAQGICSRTKQIGDAIVAAIAGAESCEEVTGEQLSGITGLDVSGAEIESLQAGDFDGLTALELLKLSDNELTSLPIAIFADLADLENLELQDNKLGRLSSDVLCGMRKLKKLNLANNGLTRLAGNQFLCVPDLQSLQVGGNELSQIPDGFFLGLGSLLELDLADNAVTPLSLGLKLEKVGDDRFKAVAPAGAPFRLVLPVSVSSDGRIASGVDSVTIAAGESESTSVEVTRVSGTADAVTVDFGSLPNLPSNHAGYALEKDEGLPLEVLSSMGGVCARTQPVRDAIVSAVSGVDECEDITADHLSEISSLTVRSDVPWSLQSGDFDGLATLRFVELSYAQLESLPGDVFSGLGALERIGLYDNNLNTLPAELFADLTALRTLNLGDNDLSSLPSGLLEGLTALRELRLNNNDLSSLRSDAFSDLRALQVLVLARNDLSSLPSGLFSSSTRLRTVDLATNRLRTLPSGLFSGLGRLEELSLDGNELRTLPTGIFSGLTALERLWLSFNELSSLPSGVFSDLTALEYLNLESNQLTDLRADTFTGLTALKQLRILTNRIDNLPSGLLSDLTNLELLALSQNRLGSLPDGFFSGLTELQTLYLDGNAIDPLPIPISLQKVGASRFKAVAPKGAPFTMDIPVASGSSGQIEGDATTLSISAGDLESAALAVTRVAGTNEAISVNIGTLPNPPGNHVGYTLQKDDSLPLEILEAQAPRTNASLSGLSLGNGTLTPSFATGTTTYSALVANAVSSITVTPTTSDSNATVDYLDGNDQEISDADAGAAGQQAALQAGENTIKTRVTAQDGTTTSTYTIVVTRNRAPAITTSSPVSVDEDETDVVTLSATDADGHDIRWSISGGADADRFDLTAAGALTFSSPPDFEEPVDADSNNQYVVVVQASDGTDTNELTLTVRVLNIEERLSDVCDRTTQVRDAIVTAISGVDDCAAVTASHLARITELDLADQEISSLNSGDFAQLSALTVLDLEDNELVSLPSGLFGGLSVLEELLLNDNSLRTLPRNIFSGLGRLVRLDISGNDYSSLRSDLLSGLNSLETLDMTDSSLTSLPSGLFSGLTALTSIELQGNELTALPAGIFSGLTALEGIQLHNNRLTSLPRDVFSGLSALELISLSNNRLTGIPSGSFSGMSALTLVGLGSNRLTSIPENAFSGSTGLTTIRIDNNRLSSVPSSLFSGLTSITELRLSNNELSALPAGIFSDSTSLGRLDLHSNRLQSLPDGIFAGLGELYRLTLEGNAVDPLPLSISLEKVGTDQFRAVAPGGSPFSFDLPVSVSSDGEIEDGADSIRFAAGSVETDPLRVTRRTGTRGAVTMDIGTLPSLPTGHSGYTFEKHGTLPLEILAAPVASADDATLSALSLSSGTLNPSFASGTTSYEASVGRSVGTITVTPATGNANASVAFRDVRDELLADADANAGDQQVDLLVGENTIRIEVTAQDGTTKETYTIVVTRGSSSGVCARTEQVKDAIVSAISGINACDRVTSSHLSAISSLVIEDENISSLKSGDFENLTGLATLDLGDNRLSSLPSGIFSGLTALEDLRLGGNQLTSLRSSVFSGLSALREVRLSDNRLRSLPSGIFSGLTALEQIRIYNNQLTGLPSGVFSGLNSLTRIGLGANDLTRLPANVFSGLTALRYIGLYENELSSLPADIFSGLTALETIALGTNQLTSLPAGVFSGLTALESLRLGSNRLSSLPDGIFTGLTSLDELILGGNSTDPLPVSVSLENVGDSEFKAVAPAGAPFELGLPVTASSAGVIDGDASAVRISAGGVESPAVGVSRVAGTTDAVTVDIGTLPDLPANHSGYRLEKSASLPLEIPSPTEAVNVCDRTSEVRDAIVRRVRGVEACGDITAEHLSQITALDLEGSEISILASGDFAGLGNLRDLSLAENELSSLPDGIFSGLSRLRTLGLAENSLNSLSSSIFSGLAALETLDLDTNELGSLPTGIFSDLTSLKVLYLGANQLSSLPNNLISHLSALEELYFDDNQISSLSSDTFSGLTSITHLQFSHNPLTTLPAEVFSGLSTLEDIRINSNRLSSLPSGVFDGLSNLETLAIGNNRLSSLPSGIFSDLTSIEYLGLNNNRFSTLPADMFSGLDTLERLNISYNSLSTLPDGIFSGLSSLVELFLQGNTANPLPLSVSLEKVGSSQFKAVVPVGAPFGMDIPVSVSSDGAIDGAATSLTVSVGAVESDALGVTRESGTTAAVTANIGTLPDLPSLHMGYTLEKDDALPLEVLPAQASGSASRAVAHASFADVNRNGAIEAGDAMILRHAYDSGARVGDGEAGGTAEARQLLLSGLADMPGASDDILREMLRRANDWRDVGVEVGGDLNSDGVIDGDDAMIMYYAYELQDLLGDGETGGTARFRRSLLAELSARPNPGDADLRALLRNAHALRAAAAEAAQ